jgi:chromosome segregation ATPase
MAAVLTREQAAAAVAAAVAERDTIQANLLDLDGSFGKRLLAGAKLTGETRRRWDAVTAAMTTLWETFSAYSAVVDRAAEVLAGGKLNAAKLAELDTLLNGASVRLARASSAVARGDLTGKAETELTPAAAIREMRSAFADAADVVAAAENVWNAIADQLQQVAADLAAARQRTDGLADSALADALGPAEAELGQLRDLLNSDPLALWRGGQVDTARLDRLRQRAAVAMSKAGELAALRDHADQRISAVATTVSAARQAWQDAMAARERAADRIAAAALPQPPGVRGLADRLAELDALKAAGRWPRLASELDLLEGQAEAVANGCREAERQATALIDRRDELRGLLDAYQARAAKLGGAEDSELDARYDRARVLLWTAPCDLSAAADAVTGYQQAVLALSGRKIRQ